MRRHVKAVPILVAAAGLAAIFLITGLIIRADTSRRAQAELGQVSTELSQASAASMGLALGVPAQAIGLRLGRLEQQVEAEVHQLQARRPVPALAEVQRSLSGEFAADEGALTLVEQMTTRRGRAFLAKSLRGSGRALSSLVAAEERVTERETNALDQAAAQYAQRASSARTQAWAGSAGAILLLLIAFFFAYRRSLQARERAEALADENGRMADTSRREALTDALTSLGNRRALVAALDAALADVAAAPVALALFDLDGFKQYNDTFGHQAGDALLARFGERLVECVGDRGGAYRMGGDEFCVLIRVDGEDPVDIARRCSEALSESGEAFEIGCSFGIALAPAEATSAEQALRIADERMYEQKSIGKRTNVTRQTADALLQVIAERNEDLAEHVSGVADLASTIARRFGMSDFEIRQVHLAAQLHDVGKSAIPDTILHKPGPLDSEEWEFMRRHTVIGERIVRAASAISHVGPIIRSSHERLDGTGYPDRLQGDEIPLGARIIAVCDAFDAMVTDRSYRGGMSIQAALAELRRCAGTQFDPDVVDEFCRLADVELDRLRGGALPAV